MRLIIALFKQKTENLCKRAQCKLACNYTASIGIIAEGNRSDLVSRIRWFADLIISMPVGLRNDDVNDNENTRRVRWTKVCRTLSRRIYTIRRFFEYQGLWPEKIKGLQIPISAP